MSEKVFCKGLRTFPKHEKQPEFVLGSLIIEPETLIEFIKGEGKQYLTEYKGKKQLKLQMLKPKDGNGVNFVVDTYKKEEAFQVPDKDSDLPF